MATRGQAGLPVSNPQERVQQAYHRSKPVPVIANKALLTNKLAEHNNKEEPEHAYRPAGKRVQSRLPQPQPRQLLRPVTFR